MMGDPSRIVVEVVCGNRILLLMDVFDEDGQSYATKAIAHVLEHSLFNPHEDRTEVRIRVSWAPSGGRLAPTA